MLVHHGANPLVRGRFRFIRKGLSLVSVLGGFCKRGGVEKGLSETVFLRGRGIAELALVESAREIVDANLHNADGTRRSGLAGVEGGGRHEELVPNSPRQVAETETGFAKVAANLTMVEDLSEGESQDSNHGQDE